MILPKNYLSVEFFEYDFVDLQYSKTVYINVQFNLVCVYCSPETDTIRL